MIPKLHSSIVIDITTFASEILAIYSLSFGFEKLIPIGNLYFVIINLIYILKTYLPMKITLRIEIIKT